GGWSLSTIARRWPPCAGRSGPGPSPAGPPTAAVDALFVGDRFHRVRPHSKGGWVSFKGSFKRVSNAARSGRAEGRSFSVRPSGYTVTVETTSKNAFRARARQIWTPSAAMATYEYFPGRPE